MKHHYRRGAGIPPLGFAVCTPPLGALTLLPELCRALAVRLAEIATEALSVSQLQRTTVFWALATCLGMLVAAAMNLYFMKTVWPYGGISVGGDPGDRIAHRWRHQTPARPCQAHLIDIGRGTRRFRLAELADNRVRDQTRRPLCAAAGRATRSGLLVALREIHNGWLQPAGDIVEARAPASIRARWALLYVAARTDEPERGGPLR